MAKTDEDECREKSGDEDERKKVDDLLRAAGEEGVEYFLKGWSIA